VSTLGNPLRNIINEFQLGEVVSGTTIISAAAQTLPQTGTANLFTISGGAVLVTGLWGIVQTAIQNSAVNLSLGLAPTVGTAATAGVGGPTSIQNLAAGTLIAAPAAAGAGGVSLTAPSVPATTVAAVNNYHGTVDVAISANGATITNVSVNGVTAGTSAGTYSVPAHGSISIAYTVATPTWTWTGSVALETNANGTLSIPKDVGFVASAGTITWTTSASRTGAVKWYCEYLPIDGVVVKGPKVS
jgi:hypothetical protein